MRLTEENIVNKLEDCIKWYEYGLIITPSKIIMAIELIKDVTHERDLLLDLVRRIEALPDCNNCGDKNTLWWQAADAIEELSKHEADMSHNMAALSLKVLRAEEKTPRWIPATERLPDAGERVLCYCRANIYEVMKMRTNGDWVHDTKHVYMHSFVTHWMPLPPAPKEG